MVLSVVDRFLILLYDFIFCIHKFSHSRRSISNHISISISSTMHSRSFSIHYYLLFSTVEHTSYTDYSNVKVWRRLVKYIFKFFSEVLHHSWKFFVAWKMGRVRGNIHTSIVKIWPFFVCAKNWMMLTWTVILKGWALKSLVWMGAKYILHKGKHLYSSYGCWRFSSHLWFNIVLRVYGLHL